VALLATGYHAGFMLCFFDPEDGSHMFLRNRFDLSRNLGLTTNKRAVCVVSVTPLLVTSEESVNKFINCQ
jgi:hypothetical protein